MIQEITYKIYYSYNSIQVVQFYVFHLVKILVWSFA